MAMSFSTGSSDSSGSSQSTGGSYIPDFPQSPLLMEFANYSRSLAPKMLDWATAEYNKNAALADSMITEGNQYASPGRIKQDMGMAEAGVQQGADRARQSALRDLQSYGIDPSSGRYAELDQAERTKAAAAAAGAGNQQRMATEATGRAIRSEGLNLRMANSQFGANAMRIPNDYLGTAMNLRYPPLGHNQQSTSQQSSTGRNQSNSSSPGDSGGGQGNRGGGRGGGGQGGGGDPGYYRPGSDYRDGNGGPGRAQNQGRAPGRTNASVSPVRGNPDFNNRRVDSGYYDPASYAQNSYDLPYTDSLYNPYSAYNTPENYWGNQDYTDPYSGWQSEYTGGGQWDQGSTWDGDWGYNPMDVSGQDWAGDSYGDAYSSDYNQYADYDPTGSTYDNSGWEDYSYDPGYDTSWQDSGDYGSYDSGSYDSGSYDPGYYDSGSDWYSNDSPSYDTGDYSDYYAAGGPVDPSMSPSGGRQVDDVPAQVQQTGEPARINVDEFIIPRDVAMWKGQEFFQNLIMKSRAARETAPARPEFADDGAQEAARGGSFGGRSFMQQNWGAGGGGRPARRPTVRGVQNFGLPGGGQPVAPAPGGGNFMAVR
jgi:hypothetical protein